MPRCVAPRIEGLDEVMIAEEQEEYLTICAAICPYETGEMGIITRWRLTEAERIRVMEGEDIYLNILTREKGQMPPLCLDIGVPQNWVKFKATSACRWWEDDRLPSDEPCNVCTLCLKMIGKLKGDGE